MPETVTEKKSAILTDVEYNVINEVMLELHQTPRFSRADVVMSRPQDEQIRHDTQCERLLRSTDVAGHLMLAESQVAAQLAE